MLWVPKTWDEIFDGYRRVWNLLADGLDSLETAERTRAISILSDHMRGLCQLANLFDMVCDTLDHIADKYPEDRTAIVEAIEQTLHYDGKSFTTEQLATLKALRARLVDSDCHSQMMRYVGMDLVQDDFDDTGKYTDTLAPKIQSLAKEAEASWQLLEAELPWLVTDKAKNGFTFGVELGRNDDSSTLLPTLLEAQRQAGDDGNAFFVSGYFSALFSRDVERWELTLDQALEDPRLQGLVPELTLRSGMTERAASRILSLAQSGAIPLASLRMFSFGGVVRKVPEHIFGNWIDCVLASKTKDGAATAIDLFHFFYQMGNEKRQLPRELTLRVLTADALFTPGKRGFQREDYDWSQVAHGFLEQHPDDGIAIARRLIETFGEKGTITDGFNTQAEQVLTTIAESAPAAVWSELSKYLGPPVDTRAFHLGKWLRRGPLVHIPSEEVWKWVDADVETRAWYAATLVPPVVVPPDSAVCLARELLARYGDRKDVRSNLHANYSTEAWTGPASSHYLNKLERMEALRTQETNANVLRWIDEEIESLKYRVEAERIQEERGF